MSTNVDNNVLLWEMFIYIWTGGYLREKQRGNVCKMCIYNILYIFHAIIYKILEKYLYLFYYYTYS